MSVQFCAYALCGKVVKRTRRQRGRSRMRFCSPRCKKRHHSQLRHERAPGISVSASTYARIRDAAAARGLTSSAIVEQALARVLPNGAPR